VHPCDLRCARCANSAGERNMSDIGQLALPASLVPILTRYAGLHALVVGDVMLDEYFAGTVDRISPEAPVPVVRVKDTERRLGGAANVARQITALGVSVSLAGVLGCDAAGEDLLGLCASSAIDTRAVMRLNDRSTTRKLRVLGHSQQLLRLDWEDTRPCASATITDLLNKLHDIRRPDVIVLSDYAKGVVTPALIDGVVQVGARFGTPVLVDPKHRDFGRYRGATTIRRSIECRRHLGHCSGGASVDCRGESRRNGGHARRSRHVGRSCQWPANLDPCRAARGL